MVLSSPLGLDSVLNREHQNASICYPKELAEDSLGPMSSNGPISLVNLPVEILHCIFKLMDLETVKAMRSTVKLWALLGQEYLISPDFLSILYRNDFGRLSNLSNHPGFSPLIKSIRFRQGELHDYHAKHNIYFVQYMKEPIDRDRDTKEAWEHYTALKASRETFESNNYDLSLLTSCFRQLPNLSTIEISLAQCPFNNPLLHRIWSISSSRLLRRVITVSRFTNILRAVASTSTPLTHLSHDRLPFEFFSSSSHTMRAILPAFNSLISLRICSNYSIFPNSLSHPASFHGLSTCLQNAPDLQTLHLTFQASPKPALHFHGCLDDVTLPRLHTLALGGMKMAAWDAADFLARHKASLRYLQIGGWSAGLEYTTALRMGTLRELLGRVRDEMSLEKVNLKGQVYESVAGEMDVSWYFEDGAYDKNWEYEAGEGSGSELARKMEMFVIAGEEWPDQPLNDTVVPNDLAADNEAGAF